MCDFVSFSFWKADDPTPFDIQAEMTLKTNFFATRNVCTELLPIVKPHGESSFADRQVVSLSKEWAAGTRPPGVFQAGYFSVGEKNRKLCYLLTVPGFSSEHFSLIERQVLCCSVAKLCPTLWDSMDCRQPGFHVPHHLPEFAQVHAHWIGGAIQPSHPIPNLWKNYFTFPP